MQSVPNFRKSASYNGRLSDVARFERQLGLRPISGLCDEHTLLARRCRYLLCSGRAKVRRRVVSASYWISRYFKFPIAGR